MAGRPHQGADISEQIKCYHKVQVTGRPWVNERPYRTLSGVRGGGEKAGSCPGEAGLEPVLEPEWGLVR